MIGRILKNKKIWIRVAILILLAFYTCGLVYVSEAVAQLDEEAFLEFRFSEWGSTALWNSAFLVCFATLALALLLRSLSASVGIVSIAYFGIHLANAMKIVFRNEPVYPWDLTLMGEVTNIASSMNFEITLWMKRGILYVAAAIVIAVLIDIFLLRKNHSAYWKEALAGVLCVMVVWIGGADLLGREYLQEHQISFVSWDPRASYREAGFLYAFAAAGYTSETEEPEGYGKGAVEAAVAGLEEAEEGVEPNIIVLMSEAFIDLESAEKLHFDRELTPNFNRLKEQYLSGRCMTSEYGGGTANSEYEVLTSYSTYQLPSGTIAYMNVVNRDMDSYVSYLNAEDYYTVALHPYQRSFFSRDKAYSVLGFDDFYSEEHFEGAERVRGENYISDAALTDRIIEEYEKNKTSGQKFFCHAVSMQNHASFPANDFGQSVGLTADVELTEDETESIRTYATGLTYTDAALGALIDYFSNQQEPTVILFFGDHIPALGTDTAELASRIGYAGEQGSVDGKLTVQSTPYLIWNNFEETPTAEKQDLSMFQLIPYMTRKLGMQRPLFHVYMDKLFETLWGVTRQVTLSADGTGSYQVPEEAREAWEEYLLLVYDGVQGKRYGNKLLY